jgi:hypothetical protein
MAVLLRVGYKKSIIYTFKVQLDRVFDHQLIVHAAYTFSFVYLSLFSLDFFLHSKAKMVEISPPPTAGHEKVKDGFSLENILGDNHEFIEYPGHEESTPANGWDEESTKEPAAEGFCIECEGMPACLHLKNWVSLMLRTDQPAQLLCETCTDIYCEVCFAALHRKGSRKKHVAKTLHSLREKKAKSQYNGDGRNKNSVGCIRVMWGHLSFILNIDGRR